jgi:hypothetical protein
MTRKILNPRVSESGWQHACRRRENGCTRMNYNKQQGARAANASKRVDKVLRDKTNLGKHGLFPKKNKHNNGIMAYCL